jgi:hypothetical protein
VGGAWLGPRGGDQRLARQLAGGGRHRRRAKPAAAGSVGERERRRETLALYHVRRNEPTIIFQGAQGQMYIKVTLHISPSTKGKL